MTDSPVLIVDDDEALWLDAVNELAQMMFSEQEESSQTDGSSTTAEASADDHSRILEQILLQN